MEEEKNKTQNKRAKIIVSCEDELTDLLRKITMLEDQNILLTFAEESDLLISSINLKVLQEVCDDLNKNLILQIIQNANGVRNAKIAGCVTTESPSEIDEALWLAAENQKRERKESLEKALKGKPREVREAIENLDQGREPVLQDGEYQKRVQEVIEKAKNLGKNKEMSQVIQEDGLVFAVGEEIGGEEKKQEDGKMGTLVGKNFNNMSELRNIKDDNRQSLVGNNKPEKRVKDPVDKKKRKKKLIIFSILGLLSLGIAGAFAYFTLPLVQAEIYIESKAIEVEKIFKGDTNTNNLIISEGEIPIRREEVAVDRSDHERTTGEGKRGTKAEGLVVLKHWKGAGGTIPAGTKIITENLQFEFTTDVVLPEAPSQTPGIPVRALEPGAEYNLSSGKVFSVGGFAAENVTAENDRAFSGGSSEEYAMLTQEDYNKLFEKLKKEAFEEGKKQLEERLPDWEMIEGTIEQSIDGNVTTDIPIGGEGTLFNMSIKTKTEALFFNKSEILRAKEDIIKRAAVENDLFRADGDVSLELDENIETEITVEEIDGDNVTIKFWAKGNVRPRVDTEEIEKSLLGKSWDDGIKILEKMEYSDKDAKIKFYPEYFPEFLRHFPNRKGRVIVQTNLIETEVVTEIDDEGIEEDQEENEED